MEAIKQFLKSPLQIIQTDKNYGLEVARSGDVKENCLRILDLPHYRTCQQSVASIQLRISRAVHGVMMYIAEHLPHFRIEARKHYKRALWSLRTRIKKRDFEKICDLCPLHKIHKKGAKSWRAILRLHLHPSNWLQKQYNRDLQSVIAAFEHKSQYRCALENSAQLLRELQRVRDGNQTAAPRYQLVQRAADLTKMYDRLKLQDVQRGLDWICAYTRAEDDVHSALSRIATLVYENTYIRSHGKLVQLRCVTAMGWIFSPVNAIVSLLRVEYASRSSWLSELLLSRVREQELRIANHPNVADHNTLTIDTSSASSLPLCFQPQNHLPATLQQATDRLLRHCTIAVDARYIDDIYQLVIIDRDGLHSLDIDFLLYCLAHDKGERYRSEFEGRMELTVEMGYKLDFLDISICICPITNAITNKIYTKAGRTNNLLHAHSNSAFGHFVGLYSGGLFRAVTLNTHERDFRAQKMKLVRLLKDRAYSDAFIRRLQQRCHIRFDQKHHYMASLAKKQRTKKYRAIIENLFLFQSPTHIFDDKNLLRQLILQFKHEETADSLYFVKEFNRFMDDDGRLRNILSELIDDLGLIGVDVMISNSINVKLGSIILS